MIQNYSLDMLDDLELNIKKPSIIFLYWDLWAGKTTLSKSIISKYAKRDFTVNSPTYVYYNKYDDIYHFDLYRIGDYDEFVSMWWEEILDNNEGIILIEWPEKLEKYYIPDIKIYINKTPEENLRELEIVYKA